MIFARVTGTVVCTQKDEKLVGCKLLLVQPVDLAGAAKGNPIVAVDSVGSGEGELVLLVQGLSWITASLNVFSRDVTYGIQVLLQLGLWVSPVFWEFDMIPHRWQMLATLLKLNPFVYIVQGYRHSLVEQIPFWADWRLMLYFWGFTLAVWLAGYFIFKKLKPQFADVL